MPLFLDAQDSEGQQMIESVHRQSQQLYIAVGLCGTLNPALTLAFILILLHGAYLRVPADGVVRMIPGIEGDIYIKGELCM